MPRNRNSFSTLKKVLRASNGVAAPGSEAAKYVDWVTGKTKKNKVKTDAERVLGSQKTRKAYSVLPFFSPVASPGVATDRYITGSSVYSLMQATNFGGAAASPVPNDALIPQIWTKADLGALELTAGEVNNPGFYAAQIVVRAAQSGGANAGTLKTSGITGRQYRYKTNATVTLAFGKSATAGNVSAAFTALKNKAGAPAADTTRSFSLVPETQKTVRVGSSIA